MTVNLPEASLHNHMLGFIIHLNNIFAGLQLVEKHHVNEYSPAKSAEYPSGISQFSKPWVS